MGQVVCLLNPELDFPTGTSYDELCPTARHVHARRSREKTMERFDDNWRFGRADDASQPDFDDSTWRSVYLPHDWSIEDLPPSEDCPRRTGPFDPDLSGGKGATGHFVGGVAWYRKRFVLKATEHA